MASRDLRRAKAKQGATVSESMEKRRQLHPALYIFSILVLIVVVVTFVASPVARTAGGTNHIVFGTWDGREIAWNQGNYAEARMYYEESLALDREPRKSLPGDLPPG